MKTITELLKEKPWLGWIFFISTVILVFIIGLFASSIMERRSEEKALFQILKPIADWEPRNAVWGENFPREYETYLQTQDTTFRSKHGGGAIIDMLEHYPNLVVLWAGFAFSRDYKQARGHYYAVDDVRRSLRTGVPQPGTCWSCKSTDFPRLVNKMGAEKVYQSKLTDLGAEAVNPIGCQDCHDNKTMNLRITRPALIEAFQRMGRNIEQASHQEMRSLVCAQCHVEYYFKGDGKYLTFPWDKGFSVEAMEQYYDQISHTDFVHKLSRAKILKSQHPDYELFLSGIHAQRGLSCADCHMPYRSEGGVKFTNHKIQSPLANIASSCAVCHRESEQTLLNNVYERQDKIAEIRLQVEDNLVKAHIEAKTAWDHGATEKEMEPVLLLIRHAQWRWDFVASSLGGSFHAPIESFRILGSALNKTQEARLQLVQILLKYGVKLPIQYPDLSTKEKAQAYIGLDIKKLKEEKEKFLREVIPTWEQKAKERYEPVKTSSVYIPEK